MLGLHARESTAALGDRPMRRGSRRFRNPAWAVGVTAHADLREHGLRDLLPTSVWRSNAGETIHLISKTYWLFTSEVRTVVTILASGYHPSTLSVNRPRWPRSLAVFAGLDEPHR